MTAGIVGRIDEGGRGFFDAQPKPSGTWIPDGSFPNEPDDNPFALVLY